MDDRSSIRPSKPSAMPWRREWDSHRSVWEAFWRSLSPAQLFAGSFLGLILLGTVGFKMLSGLYTGLPLGWIDVLFTATSAVCVTGLIVVDTATYFTTWGQAYILLLIQIGGLGFISFTSAIIVALGQRRPISQSASRFDVSVVGIHNTTTDEALEKVTGLASTSTE